MYQILCCALYVIIDFNRCGGIQITMTKADANVTLLYIYGLYYMDVCKTVRSLFIVNFIYTEWLNSEY